MRRSALLLALLLVACAPAVAPNPSPRRPVLIEVKPERRPGEPWMWLVLAGMAEPDASCQFAIVVPVLRYPSARYFSAWPDRAPTPPPELTSRTIYVQTTANANGLVVGEQRLVVYLEEQRRQPIVYVTLRCDPGGVSETVPVNPWV